MAVGLSPKHIENFETKDLSRKQALIIALETAKKLNWNIGFLSENEFIAYTNFSMSSWSEEVQIKIEDGNINVKSSCTSSQLIDWGKNKKNTQAFTSKFNTIKGTYDSDELESKYLEIEKEFVSAQDGITSKSPLNQKENVSGFTSLFKPTEGYLITPILLILNCLLFIIMIITGVDFMLPDGQSLLLWGANFRPVTLDGEWWRLITSCFLHIGVLHLLMNMYALLYIGLLLEPYLGKARFLSAYLLTGIAGSAASLYWNDLTISAGASGAIFGMYGVFLALLTTNLIEKSARKALLTSIAVFVGFNLINGMKGGIDNAAHIGGLVSGLIIGFSFYPSLVKPTFSKLKIGTIGLVSLFIVSFTFIILTTTNPSDLNKYDAEMEQFALLEEEALSMYHLPETATDQEFLNEIQNTGIPNWEANLELLDRVDQLVLPESIQERNLKLKTYCQLRLKSCKLIYNAISENSDNYQLEIDSCNFEIESIINELNEQ